MIGGGGVSIIKRREVEALRHEAFQLSDADIRIKALITMEKYSVALFLTLTLLVCNFTSASQSCYCAYGITVTEYSVL